MRRLILLALVGATARLRPAAGRRQARDGSCLLRAQLADLPHLVGHGHLHRRRRHRRRRHRRRRHAPLEADPHHRHPGDGAVQLPGAAAKRRGDCHAVEATDRLEELLRAGKMRVRLAAQDPTSRSRGAAAALDRGQARPQLDRPRARPDAGGPGAVAALPRRVRLEPRLQRAAGPRAAAAGLWDPDYCGLGPGETANCACGSTGTRTATTTSTPTASGSGSRTSTRSTR